MLGNRSTWRKPGVYSTQKGPSWLARSNPEPSRYPALQQSDLKITQLRMFLCDNILPSQPTICTICTRTPVKPSGRAVALTYFPVSDFWEFLLHHHIKFQVLNTKLPVSSSLFVEAQFSEVGSRGVCLRLQCSRIQLFSLLSVI